VKRREFLRTGAATALAAPIATPAIAQSAPEIKWRMTSSIPKTLDAIYGAGQMVSRYVAEATDKKFNIELFQPGELVQSQQALSAVGSGSVECAFTPLYMFVSKDPTLAFGTGIPFGLNSRHHYSWWAFGGGGDIVNASLKRLGATALPAGLTGVQMGAWFKNEINSVDDLKGLRFRISGMGRAILPRLGVATQHMPHSDTYAALEQGNLDGAEFVCPYDDDKLGITRVAKYNYNPCWWESGGMVHMVVNLDSWKALPKTYQSIVTRACDAACNWLLAKYDAVNPSALKRLVLAGAVLKAFPQPVLEACYKAAHEHYAELAGKDPQFKKALDSLTQFGKHHVAWWQVSEYALETFMLTARGRV
jgi:TRAP-type mannitol/chloroaromatic compound transport system substrate-binding protein